MMKLKWLIIAALVPVLGCDRHLTPEQKIEMLRAERAQVFADLIRHDGECRAVAFEFPDDRRMLGNCLDTHRSMIESARTTAVSIDNRIAEIRRENPNAISAPDLTYDPNWKPPEVAPIK